MATYHCPVCARSFEEPGFCPYDGKALIDGPGQAPPPPGAVTSEAVSSEAVSSDAVSSGAVRSRAMSEQPTLTPEDAATLPSGPETVPSLPLTRPDKGQGQTTVRAVSASDKPDDAVAALGDRASVYDRLIGQTLDGRYLVQRKIGEGGMGVVFAVKHAVIERPLAIKVLKREAMRDNATIQRFVQEAKAASRIGHPNIVDVTDFGTTPDGLTYSVMEYVDGATLAKTIRHAAPFPPARAVWIASQIARALEAAHVKGIVHRDLKPENVFLVDREGRHDFVKIVDFGIAKVQPIEGTDAGPRLTRVGAVFGTPEYMAPEQASGRGDTDHRVDIYALGVILYEMVVGKVPLRGDSAIRTIAMQMLDKIEPPSRTHPDLDIPAALEAVIMKALAKDRDQRYATMGEMLAALDEVAPSLDAASPTISLAPLPPGADAGAEGGPVLLPDPATTSPGETSRKAAPPRRARPETRQLHEPEFVAGGPLSLHVFDEAAPPERRSRLWPALGALLVLLAGAGGAVLLLSRGKSEPSQVAGTRDAGDAGAQGDAAQVVEAPADAGVAPDDAIELAGFAADAGGHDVRSDRDAGVLHPRGTHPATITVEILTRPAEADVFQGRTFRGPSGVRLTERWGTKLDLECRAPHLKGKVHVVFDGSRTSVMCTATRIKMCVEGIKNPYDECEEPEPGAGTGAGTGPGPVTTPRP